MKAHPAAEAYRLMTEDELAGLADDITQNGLIDAIFTTEQEDAHRYLAKRAHPNAGGSHERMADLNAAKQLALKEIDQQQCLPRRAASHDRSDEVCEEIKWVKRKDNSNN
jgi:hypothetical protein